MSDVLAEALGEAILDFDYFYNPKPKTINCEWEWVDNKNNGIFFVHKLPYPERYWRRGRLANYECSFEHYLALGITERSAIRNAIKRYRRDCPNPFFSINPYSPKRSVIDKLDGIKRNIDYYKKRGKRL